MNDTRHESRATSSERCALQVGSLRYQCRLDNISAGGARVNCTGFLREVWTGDRGVLQLPGRPEGVGCHVTHIAAAKIGLEFDQKQ